MFNFKRSLIALVGVVVLVGALATMMPLVSRGQGGNPFNRDTRKSYYLTQTQHPGNEALTACASDYHMASLWEIIDTSNLKYNTVLGVTDDDSGFGPPQGNSGWIRTGGPSTSAIEAGLSNCQAYTSSSNLVFGTLVGLPVMWSSPNVTAIDPWRASTHTCDMPDNVWCMQD